MRFKERQTVVLNGDLPEFGSRRGAPGAIVQLYAPDGLEVESVSPSGETQALVTLEETDVRAVGDGDLIAARPLDRSASRNRPTSHCSRPDSSAAEKHYVRPSNTCQELR